MLLEPTEQSHSVDSLLGIHLVRQLSVHGPSQWLQSAQQMRVLSIACRVGCWPAIGSSRAWLGWCWLPRLSWVCPCCDHALGLTPGELLFHSRCFT